MSCDFRFWSFSCRASIHFAPTRLGRCEFGECRDCGLAEALAARLGRLRCSAEFGKERSHAETPAYRAPGGREGRALDEFTEHFFFLVVVRESACELGYDKGVDSVGGDKFFARIVIAVDCV
ncbi:hypothetical protein TcCL_NonESM05190 [Trypanosoma cruzi]|nr:hypothetical protein TcCL_NonESM05190 [Trypanosoma cruzi]